MEKTVADNVNPQLIAALNVVSNNTMTPDIITIEGAGIKKKKTSHVVENAVVAANRFKDQMVELYDARA